jgi:anti-sigma regulatory factor (Ser/Thr protein kinase)
MAIDSVRRSFAPDRDAPAAARRMLDGFRGRLEEDVIERSALVVTEVVTNCVTHAGLTAAQPIDLNIQASPGCLRIEVTDQGTTAFEPAVTLPSPGQNSGRGFWMVDRLTDRWGVDFTRSTRVWCEFDLDPHWGSLAIRQTRARSALRIRPVNQGRSRL